MFQEKIRKTEKQILLLEIGVVLLVLSLATETILTLCGIFTFNLISVGVLICIGLIIRQIRKEISNKNFTKLFYEMLSDNLLNDDSHE
jgi:archaellum biogenesis protein FlaJ (TadC family)